MGFACKISPRPILQCLGYPYLEKREREREREREGDEQETSVQIIFGNCAVLVSCPAHLPGSAQRRPICEKTGVANSMILAADVSFASGTCNAHTKSRGCRPEAPSNGAPAAAGDGSHLRRSGGLPGWLGACSFSSNLQSCAQLSNASGRDARSKATDDALQRVPCPSRARLSSAPSGLRSQRSRRDQAPTIRPASPFSLAKESLRKRESGRETKTQGVTPVYIHVWNSTCLSIYLFLFLYLSMYICIFVPMYM